MFSIGFGELAVICIVLIIAVGPERLPGMMKTVGKTMRSLRQASRDIRTASGIDELMREDLYHQPRPVRPPAPDGPAPVSRADALTPPSFDRLAGARQRDGSLPVEAASSAAVEPAAVASLAVDAASAEPAAVAAAGASTSSGTDPK